MCVCECVCVYVCVFVITFLAISFLHTSGAEKKNENLTVGGKKK
uniref:Uncharacterized protein n=1 Tax=Anguilla anguilla TaxID=7936 RepID=A0A0E9SUL1_ANGAN